MSSCCFPDENIYYKDYKDLSDYDLSRKKDNLIKINILILKECMLKFNFLLLFAYSNKPNYQI